ncbi:uncharacterized protein LOC114274352 [Camellia sinensis]|uniref:uncharacterized protein LOC114274352 n=1 Tax=Camellia sinensis TaxID=4442 RepID=UPI0010362E08|nr:uncharacterized protein LOC114274352 [Camellia sinensis]
MYAFEKQFRAAYTNAKFKEVQTKMKCLLYCYVTLVKEEGSICTYHVKKAVLVGEKIRKVEFVVYYNSIEYDIQCMCRWFEFRGVLYAHSLWVLLKGCIYEVSDKYRTDLERGYTCIPTTYTNSGPVLNAKVHDNYHETLDEIIEIASNDDGKHKVIQLGLIEINDRVRQDQSGYASHMPPSTTTVSSSDTSPKTELGHSTTNTSMTRKVLSPMVVC